MLEDPFVPRLSGTKDAGTFFTALSVCLGSVPSLHTCKLQMPPYTRQPRSVMASNPPDLEESLLSESKCKGLMEAEGDGYLGRAHQGESHSFEEIDNLGCLCCSFSRRWLHHHFITAFQLEIMVLVWASLLFLPALG